MRLYDLVVVIRTSVKDTDRKKLIETVKAWFEGIKVTKEDDWGQKALAYPIKKQDAGNYYLIQFESEKGVEKGIESRLLRNENILRHLLLRTK